MITVTLPATTANLGPGFDSIGLALDLRNRFTLNLGGDPGTIEVETIGEGSSWLAKDETNLVAATMVNETWPGMMPTDQGIRIRCENNIPAASGLGSSSTAVLAGLIFASTLAARAIHRDDAVAVLNAVKAKENMDRVLKRSVNLEGHGDNVAPSLLGGLQLVVSNGEVIVRRVDFSPIKVVVCVPDFNFLTSVARAALPGEYSRADAIFNIGHALMVLDALRTGDNVLLKKALADRIHEPYRMDKIPGASAAKSAALDAGALACCMSGAGPGMLGFAESGHDEIGTAMVGAFAANGLKARYWVLDGIQNGVEIFAP